MAFMSIRSSSLIASLGVLFAVLFLTCDASGGGPGKGKEAKQDKTPEDFLSEAIAREVSAGDGNWTGSYEFVSPSTSAMYIGTRPGTRIAKGTRLQAGDIVHFFSDSTPDGAWALVVEARDVTNSNRVVHDLVLFIDPRNVVHDVNPNSIALLTSENFRDFNKAKAEARKAWPTVERLLRDARFRLTNPGEPVEAGAFVEFGGGARARASYPCSASSSGCPAGPKRKSASACGAKSGGNQISAKKLKQSLQDMQKLNDDLERLKKRNAEDLQNLQKLNDDLELQKKRRAEDSQKLNDANVKLAAAKRQCKEHQDKIIIDASQLQAKTEAIEERARQWAVDEKNKLKHEMDQMRMTCEEADDVVARKDLLDTLYRGVTTDNRQLREENGRLTQELVNADIDARRRRMPNPNDAVAAQRMENTIGELTRQVRSLQLENDTLRQADRAILDAAFARFCAKFDMYHGQPSDCSEQLQLPHIQVLAQNSVQGMLSELELLIRENERLRDLLQDTEHHHSEAVMREVNQFLRERSPAPVDLLNPGWPEICRLLIRQISRMKDRNGESSADTTPEYTSDEEEGAAGGWSRAPPAKPMSASQKSRRLNDQVHDALKEKIDNILKTAKTQVWSKTLKNAARGGAIGNRTNSSPDFGNLLNRSRINRGTRVSAGVRSLYGQGDGATASAPILISQVDPAPAAVAPAVVVPAAGAPAAGAPAAGSGTEDEVSEIWAYALHDDDAEEGGEE